MTQTVDRVAAIECKNGRALNLIENDEFVDDGHWTHSVDQTMKLNLRKSH